MLTNEFLLHLCLGSLAIFSVLLIWVAIGQKWLRLSRSYWIGKYNRAVKKFLEEGEQKE